MRSQCFISDKSIINSGIIFIIFNFQYFILREIFSIVILGQELQKYHFFSALNFSSHKSTYSAYKV